MGINWATVAGVAGQGIGETAKGYANAAQGMALDTSKLRMAMDELGLHKERLALDASQIQSMNALRGVQTAAATAQHESMNRGISSDAIFGGPRVSPSSSSQNPPLPGPPNVLQDSSVTSEDITPTEQVGPAPGQKVQFDIQGANPQEKKELFAFMSNNYPDGKNQQAVSPQQLQQAAIQKQKEDEIGNTPIPVAMVQPAFKDHQDTWATMQKAAQDYMRTAPDGSKYMTGYDMKAFSEMLKTNKEVRLNVIQSMTADAARNYSQIRGEYDDAVLKFSQIEKAVGKDAEKAKLQQKIQDLGSQVTKWGAEWQGGLRQMASLDEGMAKEVVKGLYGRTSTGLTFDQRLELKRYDHELKLTNLTELKKMSQKWNDDHMVYKVRYTKADGTPVEENITGIAAFQKRDAELALDKTIKNKESGKMGTLGAVNPFDVAVANLVSGAGGTTVNIENSGQ
jgi:hypothetical protein